MTMTLAEAKAIHDGKACITPDVDLGELVPLMMGTHNDGEGNLTCLECGHPNECCECGM